METMILGPDGTTDYTHTIAESLDAMFNERCKRFGWTSIMVNCTTGESECLQFTDWHEFMDPFGRTPCYTTMPLWYVQRDMDYHGIPGPNVHLL